VRIRLFAGLIAGALGSLAGASACDEGVGQAAACERYVACIRALDQRRGQITNLDRFEAGGPCWGSQEGATLCERACVRGLQWEAQRDLAAPVECDP
jgi:hypothetical protein